MLQGTIFGTVWYAVAFVACVINIYRYRKSHKPMNGFAWLVFSFLTAVCTGALLRE